MEEFTKWFNAECDDDRIIYPSSYDDCKDAWRAALEWTCINEFDIDAILYELQKG